MTHDERPDRHWLAGELRDHVADLYLAHS